MAAPNVTIREIDLSTRVPSFPGVYGALLIPDAKKGPVNEPYLITSETQLLEVFTPNEKVEVGYDLAYYSAIAFLQKSNKLWVSRVADTPEYGGTAIKEENYALTASLLVDCTNPDSDVTFTAQTVGAIGNTYSVEYVDPLAADQNLVVKLIGGTDVQVSLATNGVAAITTTASDISATVNGGATKASVLVDCTAVDSDVTIEADVAGAAGNDLNITYTDPGAPGVALSLTLTGGTDIDVTLATDGVGAITSTATDVATLLNTDPQTASLVLATPEGAGIVNAVAQTWFTGGNDDVTGIVEADAEGAGTGIVELKVLENLAGGEDISYNESWTAGEEDPTTHAFGVDEVIAIFGANGGEWNNNIRIKIYKYYASEYITVDETTDEVTVTQFWSTGIPVKFSADGLSVLPAPLEAGTYYFVINKTDTTIQLAETYADAMAGTPIDLTTAGTGTFQMAPVYEKCKEPGAFLIEVYKGDDTVNALESYTCSRVVGHLDGYGRNIYIEDVLEQSMYIRGISNSLISDTVYPKEQLTALSLAGGDDGAPVTDGTMLLALDDFVNSEDIPVTLLMDGGWATPAYQKQGILALAENRKDCVGLLSTPYDKEASSNYLNDIVDYRKTILNANSSYGAIYTPHPRLYDKFNDRYLYVSPDGFVGAIISETAANYEMWYPPAGFRRGILKVLDLRRRFTFGEMDYLYDNGINPLRFAPGRGILVWGQKTLLSRPSALDRMNVRLLLVVIEPAIAYALEDFIFELNDAATRSVVTLLIEAYMSDIQSRRGVYDYQVVCDDTNNSSVDIDNYKMNVWLFVKPTKAIEYIPFTVVITSTGMDFSLAQELI